MRKCLRKFLDQDLHSREVHCGLAMRFGSKPKSRCASVPRKSLGKRVWRGKCLTETFPISSVWQPNRNKHESSKGTKTCEKSSCYLELQDVAGSFQNFSYIKKGGVIQRTSQPFVTR